MLLYDFTLSYIEVYQREQLSVGAFLIYEQLDQSVPNREPGRCNLQNAECDFCTFELLSFYKVRKLTLTLSESYYLSTLSKST